MSLDHTYRALADPSRRAMLRALSQGQPLSVSDLAAPLPIGLPTVMKHLHVLARAGLIERRKLGRTVAVTLAPEPMAEAMRWIERTEAFWSARLDRLADVVEKEATMTTSLTIARTVRAPPQAVFDAFVNPEKIALWWGPDDGPVLSAEVEPREGGRIHVRFRMEDGSEHGSAGVFETFDPPRRLAMSWAWDSDTDEVSHVAIDFRPVSGGTEVTFTHSRLPDAASRDSHEEGWNGAFDKLEARAEELA